MVRHTQRKKIGKHTRKNGRRMRMGGEGTSSSGSDDYVTDVNNVIDDTDISSSSSSEQMGGCRRRRRQRQRQRQRGGDTESSYTSTSGYEGGRKRRRNRSMKGGSGAAEWVQANFGTGEQQWQNTFGGNSLTHQGNLLPTVVGAPAVVTGTLPQGFAVNAANVSAAQSGGQRRKKKGGFWGNVVSQALVPFGLLFAQNRFSKRHRKH